MSKKYITEKEFSGFMQTLIDMIEKGASKEETIGYLKGLIDATCEKQESYSSENQTSKNVHGDVIDVLKQIRQILYDYGFENEIRTDRREGPYINIGDVSRKRLRAQFWYNDKKNEINFWVGKEMRVWYALSLESIYKLSQGGTDVDKEIRLTFPNMESVIAFIEAIAAKYGRI